MTRMMIEIDVNNDATSTATGVALLLKCIHDDIMEKWCDLSYMESDVAVNGPETYADLNGNTAARVYFKS